MKNILVILALACASCAFAQTSVTLPTAVSAVAEYNQLATPQWALGLSALYTTQAQAAIKMYNTTTADIIPVKAVDPATGKSFYAVNASVRQGIHEKLISTGKFTFLLGADVGPGFSSTPAGGIAVSATGSFVATALYKVNKVFSIVAPVRMLYVNGIGWNPVLQLGVAVNLKNLPAPSTK
jgi:hypothetical protein